MKKSYAENFKKGQKTIHFSNKNELSLNSVLEVSEMKQISTGD